MPTQGWQTPGRIRDLALVGVFAAALFLPPLVGWAETTERGVLIHERRPVTPLPTLDEGWFSLARFPSRFEGYFSDTLGFRIPILRLRSRLLWFGLGISPAPILVRGRNGWVFLTAGKSLEVYRGLSPLSDVELEEWCFKLKERRDVLASKGVEYVHVIAPNKNQVYPDYLPSGLTQVGPTRLDQLGTYLEDHSDFKILDLRERLIAERVRDEGDLATYYPLGTHWTNRGAFAAHEAIVEVMASRLGARFPTLSPYPASKCRRTSQDKQADSWADRMYLEDLLFQAVHSHNPDPRHTRARQVEDETVGERGVVLATHDERLPRVVMFHDSFGMQLRPFLAEVTCHLTSYRDIPFAAAMDAVERADLVLDLRVERSLVVQEPDQACAWGQEGLRNLFRNSGEVFFTLSPDGVRAFADFGRLKITAATKQEEILEKDSRPGPGVIVLHDLPYSQRKSLIVAVDMDRSQAGRLRLMWRTSREQGSARMEAGQVIMPEGRSTAFFHLHPPDLRGPLHLELGKGIENYTLYRLEVRALDR